MARIGVTVSLCLVLVLLAGCGSREKEVREFLSARGEYRGYQRGPEIRAADKIRGQGINHYQMAMRVRKRKDSIKHFRVAAKLFTQALELYYDALHKYPDFQKHFVEYEIETVDKYIMRCMQYCPASVSPHEEMNVKTGPAVGLTPEERKLKARLERKVQAGGVGQ